MNYKVENVEATATMININMDIEIDGFSYNYNGEWDYKERWATIIDNQTGDELINHDKLIEVRDAIHAYLNTRDINNGNTKLYELQNECNYDG